MSPAYVLKLCESHKIMINFVIFINKRVLKIQH